jgi:D-methionine transport system substrate-binding protein
MRKTMNHPRRALLAAALALSLPAFQPALAREPHELVIGTSAGPYADQIRFGIKPILERQGYKVKVIEFSDYIQPNFALAEGSLDANVFQHGVYLKKFAADHKLALSELVTIPTAPIAIYSRRHRSLDEVRAGSTVALPNDPTNQARALVMLEQLGWIRLRAHTDPVKASERDVAANLRGVKLLPLEAAQLPRALQDADYAFVNGNFALASGLRLSDALRTETISRNYVNLVAVRSSDRDKPFARDLAAAYRSREFLAWTVQHCPGYAKTDYQLALLGAKGESAQ